MISKMINPTRYWPFSGHTWTEAWVYDHVPMQVQMEVSSSRVYVPALITWRCILGLAPVQRRATAVYPNQ